MEVQNNPAGRLHDILTAAKKANPNSPLSVVWAQALGCDVKDHAEILRLWGELIRLTRQAKTAIKELHELDESLYLAPFVNIEKLLGKMNFETAWRDVMPLLSPEAMLGLKFAADRLKREGGATMQLQSDVVRALTEDLDAMLETVLASDLPEKLRKLFARNLEQLRQALIALRISGAEGLEQELDRALGSIFRYGDDVKTAAEDEQNETLIKDYFGLLSRCNDAVTFGQNLALFTPAVIPLLAQITS